jgi:peptidoglycan hydrolase CwlO-like protein
VAPETRSQRGLPWRWLALLLTLFGYTAAQANTPAITKAKADAQALSALISKLDSDLSQATEDYDYANQHLEQTQAQAKKTSTELGVAQKNLSSAQAQLNDRLVRIYKEGQTSTLGVLLNATSFSDFVNRFHQLSRISRQDALVVRQVQTYETQVARRQAEVATQLAQEKTYAVQTATAKQRVLAQLATQEKALKGKEAQVAQ